MSRDRPDELEAAIAVAQTLGGTYAQRDVPGAPDGTHDFDILIGSRVIALEVTSAVDGEATALWNAVTGRGWLQPTLRYSWSLTVDASTNIKNLTKSVTAALMTLESADVGKFGFGHPGGQQEAAVVDALATLSELGARGGSSIDDPPSRIVIAVVGPGVWGGPEAISEAVVREAAANAEKLARAKADERHLFVWADWTMSDIQAAIISVGNFGVMPAVPDLPSGVDTVWVAPVAMVDEREAFLWRVTPPGGWEVLDPRVLRGGRE